jgi:cytochrome c-type biogenesis protein CcmH/NrfF
VSRRMVNLGLLVGLVTALVIALWPAPDSVPSHAERTAALADELRCPYCNGESIADAPSAIARDLQDFIAEEVARGASDDEIIDFFVATYGEQVLLDPPATGWGLWLRLFPLLGLVAGVVLIAHRLRSDTVSPPAHRAVVAEQLAAARSDLAELEQQEASGEVGPDDAARLRGTYEAEVALLEGLDPSDPEPTDRRRLLVGALVLIAGVVALTVGVAVVADDRAPGGLITGDTGATSLDDVTNEEMELVIAENPDVLGMRLALAGRYFEAAEFSDALRHYLYILDRQDNAEALANVGWMTFLSGEAEAGLRFVERAVDVDADHLPAYWFLANIRFFAFDDANGAVASLERLLAADGLPDDIRAEAQSLLAQAKAEA